MVAVVPTADGRASLVVGVTDDLKERLSAIDLVCPARPRSAAMAAVAGRTLGQAGGPDAASAQAALDAIEQAIAAA